MENSRRFLIKEGVGYYEVWNDILEKYVEVEYEDSLIYCLNDRVHIEDTSFGEFLKIFINDENSEALSKILFKDAGYRSDILNLFDEMLDHPDQDRSGFDDVDYLQIYLPACEYENDPDLAYYPQTWEFSGFGSWSDGSKGGIAIEHIPICNLQDIEIRVDNSVSVFDFRDLGDDLEEEFRFEQVKPTLLDAISAVVYEMTFFGVVAPGDRTPMDDAVDMAREIEQGNVDTDEFMTFEEFKENYRSGENQEDDNMDSIDDLISESDRDED